MGVQIRTCARSKRLAAAWAARWRGWWGSEGTLGSVGSGVKTGEPSTGSDCECVHLVMPWLGKYCTSHSTMPAASSAAVGFCDGGSRFHSVRLG